MRNFKEEWFGNVKNDILAGLVKSHGIQYMLAATFDVRGHLFFVSSEKFIESFDVNNIDKDIKEVEIDFLKSEICDESAADAVKKVVEKLNKKKIKVSLIGARGDSAHLVKNLNKV